VKKLSWDDKSISVSLISKKSQEVKLVMPSEIRSISNDAGSNTIKETGEKNSRKILLQEGKVINFSLIIK